MTTDPALSASELVKQNSASKSGYLPTLDGWRTIAIVTVILFHGADAVEAFCGRWVESIMEGVFRPFGQAGVFIFFGISGFLICTRLLEEERKQGRISLKKFYIRRAFRILPPVLVFLSVVGLLSWRGILPVSWGNWLRALLFCANYGPPNLDWRVSHFWSLSVEEHFYLMWPAILVFCGSRRALRVALVVAVAVTIWRLINYSAKHFDVLLGPCAGRTDTQLDAILLGCVFALLYARPNIRSWFERYLKSWAFWALLICFVLTLALQRPHHGVTNAGLVIVERVLIPLLLITTILNPRMWASRLLESCLFRWIGRLSYSLYLWQQLFMVLSEWKVPRLGRLQDVPFNLGATVVCAVLSYYFIEKPLMALGHRLAKPATAGRGDMKI